MTIPMRMQRLQVNAQLNAQKIKDRRDILDWALAEKAKLATLNAEKERAASASNIGSLSTSASCPHFMDGYDSYGDSTTMNMTGRMEQTSSMGSLGAVSLSTPLPATTTFMHTTSRPSCTARVFSPERTAGKNFLQRVNLAKRIAEKNAAEISYRRNMLDEIAARKAREAALSLPVLPRTHHSNYDSSHGEMVGRPNEDLLTWNVQPSRRQLPRLYSDMLGGAQTGASTFKQEFAETLSQPVAPGLAADGGSLKDRLAQFEAKAMWNSYAMSRHRKDLQNLRAPL